jgi:hypothetical protein
MKSIHMMQGTNIASSRCEVSVLHLACQVQSTKFPYTTDNQASFFEHQPNTSMLVDYLTAELFSIMLTNNKSDPDSHSKLWVSHSEVQQDREQANSSQETMVDVGAGLTLDDTR